MFDLEIPGEIFDRFDQNKPQELEIDFNTYNFF